MPDPFFSPLSVAVVGASRKPGKVGHEVLKNILNSGYKGAVYPINPEANDILGVKCFQSLLDVPGSIDLVIVAVPASLVLKIAEDATRKNVRELVIISAGFKESGSEGAKLERELMTICKSSGIRVLGPNCLGLIDAYTPLNASFAPEMPKAGSIAFVSQSGALGTAVLDWALTQDIGFSKFVSLGNEADINETDMIESLVDDPNSNVILLYIEGISDGDNFMRVAKEASTRKPIIVLKSGISQAGARAASSHTGALAGSDIAFSVAFRGAGVIRVETAEELFDLAEVLSTQPLPSGPNVGIVTNAGGPGILATDACEKYGMKMASMSPEIVAKLREKLNPASGFFNPVDILGDASPEEYKFGLETILESEDVNEALIILTPQAMTHPVETAKNIIEIKKNHKDKPIVASFIGGNSVEQAVKLLEEAAIPNYEFPERAIRALSSLSRYGERLTNPQKEEYPTLEVDAKRVNNIFDKVRYDQRATLKASESTEVARAYGIPSPLIELAATAEEAVRAAEKVSFPVVMKIESPQILHKTDIGGVKLGVETQEEVRRSFYELVGRAHIFSASATILGVNVQKMVPQGREMIVGMSRDVTFGPLIMFGLGGIYVNFLKDVSFRLAPLSRQSAKEMVEETKAYTLLRGIRGEASSDIDSLIDVLLRVSKLVADFPEISELDINPLFVYEEGKGCLALDVKMTIKP
jgi:acetyl coenzyme A synthetase (ADP forming)-like protein